MQSPAQKNTRYLPTRQNPAVAKSSAGTLLAPYLILCAVIAVFEFLRRPGALLYPTLYFEDGSVFYRDQLLSGSVATVLKPFPLGYYILAPRLIAFVACLFPARFAPYIFNGAGLGIAALSASVFALPRFRQILRSDALRVALCLLFAVTLDSTEVLASAANCFWVAAIPAVLFAVLPPEVPPDAKFWRGAAFIVLGVLVGLVTPLIILAVPIAVWQLSRERRWSTWQLPVGYLVAVLIQAAVYLTMFPFSAAHKLRTDGLVTALLVASAHRVVMSSILGIRLAMQASQKVLVPLSSLFLLEGVSLFLLLRGGRAVRIKTALCLYVLGANVILSLATKDLTAGFQQIAGTVQYGGSRYFYVSSCAFTLLVALAIEEGAGALFNNIKGAWVQPVWVREGLMVLLFTAFFWGGIRGNFRCENGDDFHWARYAPAIDSWKQAVASGQPASDASIPINLPGWLITLPRNYLTNSGFEAGTLQPWGPFGSVRAVVSSGQHHEGSNSLAVDGRGGVFTDLFCARQRQKYIVGVWALRDCANPAAGRLWIHDGDGYQVASARLDGRCGDWERVSTEFTATDTHMMRIHLVNESSGVLYWDDLSIVNP